MALNNTPLSTLVTRHQKKVQDRFDNSKAAVAAYLDGLASDPHLTDQQKLNIADAMAKVVELLEDPQRIAAVLTMLDDDVVDFLSGFGSAWTVDNNGSLISMNNGRPLVAGAGQQRQQGQGQGQRQQQGQPTPPPANPPVQPAQPLPVAPQQQGQPTPPPVQGVPVPANPVQQQGQPTPPPANAPSSGGRGRRLRRNQQQGQPTPPPAAPANPAGTP